MANYYEVAQENVVLTFFEDNQRLEKELAEVKAKLQAVEAENDRLKGLLLYRKEDSAKGERMGRYVEGIRQKAFRPAFKGNASVEAIVTIMHQEKTTDLQVVADKLNVTFATETSLAWRYVVSFLRTYRIDKVGHQDRHRRQEHFRYNWGEISWESLIKMHCKMKCATLMAKR